MGFVRSRAWVRENPPRAADFYDAEMLTVYFETEPEVVERLLPPPLKPTDTPLGFVFVGNYPRTSFGLSYLESALFVPAAFNGEEGFFCLAMPVSDDMALIGGREIFGYPKKLGNIHLARSGQQVEGWTERHGARFLDIRANLNGKCNDAAAQQMITDRFAAAHDPIIFNFKYFPAPGRSGFDYNPRLIREVVELRPSHVEIGEAELALQSSTYDPWGDVEIVRVLGAIYSVGNNSMLAGSVVAEVDQMEFAPYAYMKVDV